tara:strand:+ start:2277 stop:2561 length:285 start_codon:yes stop_codon:yes gene_type:complete
MKILILLIVTVAVSVATLSPQEKDFVGIALSVQASKVMGGIVNAEGIAATKDVANGSIQLDDAVTDIGVVYVKSVCEPVNSSLDNVDIGDENCL